MLLSYKVFKWNISPVIWWELQHHHSPVLVVKLKVTFPNTNRCDCWLWGGILLVIWYGTPLQRHHSIFKLHWLQNGIDANLQGAAISGDIILRSQPKWASCPNDWFRVTAGINFWLTYKTGSTRVFIACVKSGDDEDGHALPLATHLCTMTVRCSCAWIRSTFEIQQVAHILWDIFNKK